MMSLKCSAREISKISKRPYRYEKLMGQSNGASGRELATKPVT